MPKFQGFNSLQFSWRHWNLASPFKGSKKPKTIASTTCYNKLTLECLEYKKSPSKKFRTSLKWMSIMLCEKLQKIWKQTIYLWSQSLSLKISILSCCEETKKVLENLSKATLSKQHQNGVFEDSENENIRMIHQIYTRNKTKKILRWLYQNDVLKSRSWRICSLEW